MRPPTPRSLLIEHPALPQPFEPPAADSSMVALPDLGRRERLSVAAQLVAVTALLADNELWPGRWALRSSVVEMTEEGPQIRLPALPAPLSRIWPRLGGGEPAAETTRAAVLSTIAERTGIDPGVFEPGGGEPGFFLDGVLARVLGELDRPLDAATARSLWMWRWALPPQLQNGDTTLLAITDEALARRVGAAVWAAASRRGETATFDVARPGQRPRRVAGQGEGELRVYSGAFDERTLVSILDGGGSREVDTVVVGRFPEGWNPIPAPIFDPERLAVHLTLAGISPARRLQQY